MFPLATIPVPIPKLSYPISRPYPWSFFTPLVVLGALLALAVLVPLNVALSGYQTIMTPNKDFLLSTNNWWNKFTPRPTPGTQCDALNITQGDSLTTTYGVFTWRIISPDQRNGSALFFPYKGVSLDSCDVTTLGITANLMGMGIAFSATVDCYSNNFPVSMRTSWAAWGATNDLDSRPALPGDLSPGGELQGSAGVAGILYYTSIDLWNTMLDSYNANSTVMAAFSLRATPSVTCSKAKPEPAFTPETDQCTKSDTYAKPIFVDASVDLALQLKSNGEANSNIDYVYQLGYQPAINNTLQLLLAAVRLDLGNILPNNVLTNTSIFTDVLGLAPDSGLNNVYNLYKDPSTADVQLPLSALNETQLDATFQCRMPFAKTHAETFIAVIVATFTMFNTGWTVALLAAAYFARKVPESNACVAHCTTVEHHHDPNQHGYGFPTQSGLAYNEKTKGDTSD